MKTALISHPDCLLHEMTPGHPESPQRLTAILEHLARSPLEQQLQHYQAPLASKTQLALAHDSHYVESIFLAAPRDNSLRYLDPDTSMNAHSLQAALRAAGGAIQAVDLVMQGQHRSAFCAIRPPGHHAEHNRAMGFCLFNNIAIAAMHALHNWQLQRLAIVDFDVHHGNGTEDIIQNESRILLCSTFQHPYYPFSGSDTRSEHILNLPLPAGTDGPQYRAAFEEKILPRLNAFQPQLILISAGFDGHADDGLANMQLHEADYAWITQQVKQVAEKYAEGRIVSLLEGGYKLTALARSVAAHIEVLTDEAQ